MKKILIICFFVIFSTVSCLTPWKLDKLTFYRNDYNPNYDSRLKINGFYYFYYDNKYAERNYIEDGFVNVKLVVPMFFYTDGSFYLGAIYPNLDSLKSWICKERVRKINDDWGFYKIQKDSFSIEYINTFINGDGSARRYGFNGIIKNDSTLIITENILRKQKIEKTKDTLFFVTYAWKPDSTLNWLKNHWKYKLK